MLHFNAQGVKNVFCHRKDEVLIKALVELGVHRAFNSHQKLPSFEGKDFFLAATNIPFTGVSTHPQGQKNPKNFCHFLVTWLEPLNG